MRGEQSVDRQHCEYLTAKVSSSTETCLSFHRKPKEGGLGKSVFKRRHKPFSEIGGLVKPSPFQISLGRNQSFHPLKLHA